MDFNNEKFTLIVNLCGSKIDCKIAMIMQEKAGEIK